jgi:F-type H+-transporting ATPase subunit delta
MSEFKVASRYAKSLIDLAREQNALEAIHTDMQQVIAVLKGNPMLQAVLKNPIIKLDKKEGVLRGLFGKTGHPALVEFFSLLVRKGRAGILFATAEEFIREYNVENGIIEASVVSAAPLSDEQRRQMMDVVQKSRGGNRVILTNKVDPELIGGFVLTVGDRQIDASIAGKLNKLEQHFSNRI